MTLDEAWVKSKTVLEVLQVIWPYYWTSTAAKNIKVTPSDMKVQSVQIL